MISRGGRAFSSPEVESPSHSRQMPTDQDIPFQGIAANVKLLLKLIHEQSQASDGDLDDRRKQRVAGMISILDDVKTRIQKHSPPVGKIIKEFRRCNTDLRPLRAPRDKRSADVVIDEKEKLRRDLHASSVARKSLEAMCCSLGKEKKIMASELSRKVQELNGMEELINDLKAQNETLLAKVQACAQEHQSDNKSGGETHQGGLNATLQERNKALTDQLLKSLDGYRSLKRKYIDAKEENIGIQTTMEEMGVEVAAGLGRIRGLKQQLATTEAQKSDIEEEISALECMFQSLNMKISKHMQKKSTKD
ncbi:uncharacterized protein LOC111308486 [Durio zibethinus]|uniref:Uncharacterized protein LOC111308486 n=1 Tax=Durio zibethinus TaxID=66656 RepID=A0A6P6ACL0_DURZI|nr:uncharacterized protein LOC111308486 [Durio zibethinus]